MDDGTTEPTDANPRGGTTESTDAKSGDGTTEPTDAKSRDGTTEPTDAKSGDGTTAPMPNRATGPPSPPMPRMLIDGHPHHRWARWFRSGAEVAPFGTLTVSRVRPKDMLDLAKAREELLEKTILDIERATALTWAARAAACLDLAHEAETRQGRQVRLTEAENYRQEAIEHAAMTEDIPFLQSIITEIDAHKTRKEQEHPLPGKAIPARSERPSRFGRKEKLRPQAGASPTRR